MRTELFFSLRLLRDSLSQSVLIALGAAVGVGVVIFLSALIGGLQKDLIAKTVGSQAHISIRPTEERPRPLRRDKDVTVIRRVERIAQRVRSIDGWQVTLDRLRDTSGIRAASPICRGPATAIRGSASLNVVISGIEPVSYSNIIDLPAKITAGSLDVSGRGALLGSRLAEDLGIGLGDKFRLEAGASDNRIGEIFDVRGIFEIGNRSADESWVVVSLRNGQALLNLSGGATEIEATVDSVFDAKDLGRQIREETGLEAESWMESNAQLLAGLRSQSMSSWLIQFFVLLAVTIGIASVLVVSVVQRRREIGILRAIGLTRQQAQRVFLVQGCLLSLAGSMAGSALGVGLAKAFRLFARDATGAPLFPIQIQPALFLQTGAIAVVVGLVAAAIPARHAARLDPAVAIRND